MDDPIFPQEIFDAITHFVGGTADRQQRAHSLKNLALTSRHHFLHQARRYLFRDLQIVEEPSLKQRMILERNPWLFKYTRVVTITRSADGGVATQDTRRNSDTLMILEGVFDNLENLTSLALSVTDPKLSQMVPKLFHPTLVRLSIVAYPSIVHPSSGATLQIPHTLPNLKILEMNADLGRPVLETGNSQKEEPPCSGCKGWTGNDLSPGLALCPASLYRGLVDLKILITLGSQAAAWGVINAAASSIPSLRALELAYCLTADSNPTVFMRYIRQMLSETLQHIGTLPSFPSLISLKLSLSARTKDGAPSIAMGIAFSGFSFGFSEIAFLFLKTNPQLSLKNLSINNIERSSFRFPETLEHFSPGDFETMWDNLYCTLGDRSLYPSLENVRITTLPLAFRNTLTGETGPEIPGVEKLRQRFPLVDFGLPATSIAFDEAERVLLDGIVPVV